MKRMLMLLACVLMLAGMNSYGTKREMPPTLQTVSPTASVTVTTPERKKVKKKKGKKQGKDVTGYRRSPSITVVGPRGHIKYGKVRDDEEDEEEKDDYIPAEYYEPQPVVAPEAPAKPEPPMQPEVPCLPEE